MDKVNGKLTVFFEEPFWVGIFERIEDCLLYTSKHDEKWKRIVHKNFIKFC